MLDFKAKMHQIRFPLDSVPQAPATERPTSKGSKGKGEERGEKDR